MGGTEPRDQSGLGHYPSKPGSNTTLQNTNQKKLSPRESLLLIKTENEKVGVRFGFDESPQKNLFNSPSGSRLTSHTEMLQKKYSPMDSSA